MAAQKPVTFEARRDDGVAVITLNDPERRNAMGIAMFEALDEMVARVREDEACRVVVVRGAGRVFCAGFDLAAAVERAELMATYIQHLSHLIRALRRLPMVVIGSVHGAALAGGCAILGGCDLVVVTPDAKLGYPVHLIGVSPAVTLPGLVAMVGPGAARRLVISGELIDGRCAYAMGLASHLAADEASLQMMTEELAADIAAKPPGAMRETKQWLNRLDGSSDDGPFDATMQASVRLSHGEEAMTMLSAFWNARTGRR